MHHDIQHEIERKFLVNHKLDLSLASGTVDIKQSYLSHIDKVGISIIDNVHFFVLDNGVLKKEIRISAIDANTAIRDVAKGEVTTLPDKSMYADIKEHATAMRIRITDENKSVITLKRRVDEIKDIEQDIEIPLEVAHEVINQLISGVMMHKIRHHIYFDNRKWEVDVFKGELAGLVLAEIEAPTLEEVMNVLLPDWIETDVTHENEYKNGRIFKRMMRDKGFAV